MKAHPSTHEHGFTLIELLVVISIIAVLAGLAIPTANSVMRRAKETQARAAVHGLLIAIKGYQTEYNRLPNPAAGGGGGTPTETEMDTDGANGIVNVLLGKDTTNNPREIAFYDPPTAKGEANGLITSTTEVVDPWSKPSAHQYYHMALDYDGNRSIPNPVKVSGSGKFNDKFMAEEPTDLATEIAVYCDNDPKVSPSIRKPITSW